jgi:hypothetical protein
MEILELFVNCEHLVEQLAVLVDELIPLFVVARILDELLGGSLSPTMSDSSNSHCSAQTKWRGERWHPANVHGAEHHAPQQPVMFLPFLVHFGFLLGQEVK